MFTKRSISMIALLLIIVGVVGSVLTFEKPVSKSDWVTAEKTIDGENIENIQIAADHTNIEVISVPDSSVKVEMSGIDPENDLTASVDGSTLSIQVEHRKNSLFQFDLLASISSLKVYVPEKSYELLQIESDNGRIFGEKLQANTLDVNTDNGLIELRHMNTSTTVAKTDNGKVALEYIEGDILAETDNGAISLITSHLDREIELNTDIGMIEIKTDQKPTNAVIDANVEVGKISIFGESNASTVFGNGDHSISLSTDVGKINVTK
ncbi:MAG TPA: DUF4097 family beta strand repeat-containing protein [Virgibacillus sp.]|nr:DUF4097 family beta strand repeat-containing protein [Virgibacillus sp.]